VFGKLGEKRPFERPRRRWKDDIRTNVKEIGCQGVDWIHMVQDRGQWRAVMNTVTKFWVP
jgi:hypothetical protein